MNSLRTIALLVFGGLAAGCATTSHSSTTWTAPPPPPQAAVATPAWARHGYVAWVREDVQRRDGNPAAGAATGAVIGALLGGRGPGALFGAMGGAAVGAAASQGHAEARRYDVMVQFDDGSWQVFSYGNYAPFQPGEPVVQTPQGLFRG